MTEDTSSGDVERVERDPTPDSPGETEPTEETTPEHGGEGG